MKKVLAVSDLGTIALAAVLMGAFDCGGSRSAEQWAREQLGAAGAEKYRQQGLVMMGDVQPEGTIVTMPNHAGSAYLPRPFLVLELVRDPRDPGRSTLIYSSMCAEFAFNFHAAPPRGLAILDRELKSVGRDRKGRTILTGFVEITLLDLEKNVVAYTESDKPDTARIRALLTALPETES